MAATALSAPSKVEQQTATDIESRLAFLLMPLCHDVGHLACVTDIQRESPSTEGDSGCVPVKNY